MAYLYPDTKYDDRVAANYFPQSDPSAQLLVYHTQAYKVDYSKNLKNATTTKVELGVDFKLKGGRRLSISLSPRLNLSLSVTPWLDIRGGIGMNSKTSRLGIPLS